MDGYYKVDAAHTLDICDLSDNENAWALMYLPRVPNWTVLLPKSPYLCYRLRDKHKFIKVVGQTVWPWECWQTHTHTHGSDSMTSTTDAGGNNKNGAIVKCKSTQRQYFSLKIKKKWSVAVAGNRRSHNQSIFSWKCYALISELLLF